jgi:peptidoglycan/LPS O-acetylase OafA/YrhL
LISYYSPWPPVLILLALLAFAATPLFSGADSPPNPTASRVSTLDGLRGFLALSVFFSHAAIYHTYIQGRPWGAPPERFYALLGPLGVAIFFMITGFLFWGQVLKTKGKPSWIKLYVGRVFRIGPLYLVAATLLIVSVFALTGLRLKEHPIKVAMEALRWLALGTTTGGALNGFTNTGNLIANVTWTLRYEWIFYGSLIITAIFGRWRLTGWLFPAVGVVGSLAALIFSDLTQGGQGQWPFLSLFSIGMLTAAAKPWVKRFEFSRPLYSTIATALLLTVLALFGTAYASAPIVLLGAVFFLIANGTTLFGLLITRPARRLGDVSFGIYLLQGFVLAGVFASQQTRDFSLAAPWRHWVLISGSSFLVVVAAAVAHVTIERPGIDLGRWVLQRLQRS